MKTELEVFSGAFADLEIEGFDFTAVLAAETFFSIETLIDTISIFEAEGVDISDVDFVQEWIIRCISREQKDTTLTLIPRLSYILSI